MLIPPAYEPVPIRINPHVDMAKSDLLGHLDTVLDFGGKSPMLVREVITKGQPWLSLAMNMPRAKPDVLCTVTRLITLIYIADLLDESPDVTSQAFARHARTSMHALTTGRPAGGALDAQAALHGKKLRSLVTPLQFERFVSAATSWALATTAEFDIRDSTPSLNDYFIIRTESKASGDVCASLLELQYDEEIDPLLWNSPACRAAREASKIALVIDNDIYSRPREKNDPHAMPTCVDILIAEGLSEDDAVDVLIAWRDSAVRLIESIRDTAEGTAKNLYEDLLNQVLMAPRYYAIVGLYAGLESLRFTPTSSHSMTPMELPGFSWVWGCLRNPEDP
ncbi:hypothetical protein AB8O64_02780 [Streptomyces sp. QH1-20]|uniref:terpene synthase family protein n=1 Tax=Streptomyces sp. QH1-20 TaxID=3240934 RepID=UPI00351321A9